MYLCIKICSCSGYKRHKSSEASCKQMLNLSQALLAWYDLEHVYIYIYIYIYSNNVEGKTNGLEHTCTVFDLSSHNDGCDLYSHAECIAIQANTA